MHISFSELFLISKQMFKILFQAVLQFAMLFLFPMLGCHFFLWVPHIVHINSICVAAIFLVFLVVY